MKDAARFLRLLGIDPAMVEEGSVRLEPVGSAWALHWGGVRFLSHAEVQTTLAAVERGERG